jgi:hypothetical protein
MSDDEDCELCGGCEEVTVTFQDHHTDVVACPICMAAEKNEQIECLTRERDALRSVLRKIAACQVGNPIGFAQDAVFGAASRLNEQSTVPTKEG